MDMNPTIQANSDQLDAVDIVQPRTFTVTCTRKGRRSWSGKIRQPGPWGTIQHTLVDVDVTWGQMKIKEVI